MPRADQMRRAHAAGRGRWPALAAQTDQALRDLGVATIAEVSSLTGLSRQDVAVVIRSLVADGIVDRAGQRRDGGRGRPSALYSLAQAGDGDEHVDHP
jgi:predicted ArsR family transcriptional regulator